MKIHGKNASADIGGLMVHGTEWMVEASRDYIDASVYGDDAKYFFAGLPQTNGSFTGLYNGGLSAAQGGLVAITLYYSNGAPAASGNAYVDASASAAVNDAVRVSGRFKGVGKWTFY